MVKITENMKMEIFNRINEIYYSTKYGICEKKILLK